MDQQPAPAVEKLLTTAEVAARYQVTPRTICNRAARGEFPDPVFPTHHGKRWSLAAIERFERTGRVR